MSSDPAAELASDLRRRGLSAPMRLLLEAHAPLRPLLGHAITFLSPTLRPILGARLEALEAAFEDDARWAAMLDELEAEGGR